MSPMLALISSCCCAIVAQFLVGVDSADAPLSITPLLTRFAILPPDMHAWTSLVEQLCELYSPWTSAVLL